MNQPQGLAEQFEAHRSHLRAVAYRMLGSPTEADDAVLRPNRAAAQAGSMGERRGAGAVAATFARRRAKGARLALVNGIPAAVWAPGGRPRVIFSFTIVDGKITAIDTLADPGLLSGLDVAILSG